MEALTLDQYLRMPMPLRDAFWRELGAQCRLSTELRRRGMSTAATQHSRPFRDDVLLEIEPAAYVEKLADVIVPRSGMIHCPFPGHPDRNRSMKVYREPEQGVWCFGCQRGGSIYDFAAGLWGYATRGEDFKIMRARLAEELLR